MVGNPLSGFLVNALFKRQHKRDKIDLNKTVYNRIKERPKFTMHYCTMFHKRKEKRILDRGLNRIDKMLEIDNLIRTQMQIKVAFKALLNKSERFFLKNNKVFVLNSSSDENESKKSSSSDPDEKVLSSSDQPSSTFSHLCREALNQQDDLRFDEFSLNMA